MRARCRVETCHTWPSDEHHLQSFRLLVHRVCARGMMNTRETETKFDPSGHTQAHVLFQDTQECARHASKVETAGGQIG